MDNDLSIDFPNCIYLVCTVRKCWLFHLPRPVFLYKLWYIVGFWLVRMAISTNPKPTICCNVYENTGRAGLTTMNSFSTSSSTRHPQIKCGLHRYLSFRSVYLILQRKNWLSLLNITNKYLSKFIQYRTGKFEQIYLTPQINDYDSWRLFLLCVSCSIFANCLRTWHTEIQTNIATKFELNWEQFNTKQYSVHILKSLHDLFAKLIKFIESCIE